MKTFRDFLNEETMPYAGTSKGVIDVRDAAVRDSINMQLTAITNGKFITPYIALERVSKALANFHIFLPKYSFLEGDSGMSTYEVNQFGLKMGQTDDGRIVTAENDPKYFVFFEYRMSDCGMFKVFAELVDEDELEEIMTDIDAELDGDTEEEDEDELYEEAATAMPETGARPTPGSSQPVMVTGVTIPDELEGKNRDKMKSKLEKKSLEELNMSDEQQMDDKKLDESDDWFFSKKKKKSVDVSDMERPKTKSAGYTYRHKESGKEITKATKGKPSDEWKRVDEDLAAPPAPNPESGAQLVKGPAPKSDDAMVKNMPTLAEPGMNPARTAQLAQMAQGKSVAGGPVGAAAKQAATQFEENKINEEDPYARFQDAKDKSKAHGIMSKTARFTAKARAKVAKIKAAKETDKKD